LIKFCTFFFAVFVFVFLVFPTHRVCSSCSLLAAFIMFIVFVVVVVVEEKAEAGAVHGGGVIPRKAEDPSPLAAGVDSIRDEVHTGLLVAFIHTLCASCSLEE
jgi:hypothetical protein